MDRPPEQTIFSLSDQVPEPLAPTDHEVVGAETVLARGAVGELCSVRKLSRRGAVLHTDTPVVVAGARADVPDGLDVVASDEAAGGRLAADHLIGLGHRHIVHVTGSGGPAAVRREGTVAQMDEAADERLRAFVEGHPLD